MSLLEIKNLHTYAEDDQEKEILKGLNLVINKGETHVIMGPNGAGKSTLANVILNNPAYKKNSGEVIFEGENINDLTTDKIAKKGIFMSFQSPEEIPGISTLNFLKYAKNSSYLLLYLPQIGSTKIPGGIPPEIFKSSKYAGYQFLLQINGIAEEITPYCSMER